MGAGAVGVYGISVCGLWWSGGVWQWAARRGSLSVLACMRAEAEGARAEGWTGRQSICAAAPRWLSLAVAKDDDTRAALQMGHCACACTRGVRCGCGDGCRCGCRCGFGCVWVSIWVWCHRWCMYTCIGE